ncbi:MAG: hypothetical protein PUB18_04155 [bacterium]|nr:hypothetical protein [bacterium]
MSNKVLDNHCPCCSAPLFYNTTTNHFKCNYCGNEFELKDLQKTEDVTFEKGHNETNVDPVYVAYSCSNCGAEIVADEHTSSTFCLYCGNAAILKDKLSGEFKPNKIIPFRTEKETAITAFKNLSKGRPFVPKDFLSQKNISKITGLYIPFWLYQVKVSGGIEAEGVKVSSWTRGDVHYTKKDYYKLARVGEMDYEKVPVDGSTRFHNDIMNAIEPFDYQYLIDFNYRYLSGFLAEKYDLDSEISFEEAKRRVLTSAKDIMYNDMEHYTTKTITNNTIKAEKTNVEYVLLPVWMINVKYQGQFYLFAMNGQSGKFIGDIPLDQKKVIIYAIVIFIVLFFVIMIGSYMLYQMGVVL